MERAATEIDVSGRGFIGYNTATGKYCTGYEGFGNGDTE